MAMESTTPTTSETATLEKELAPIEPTETLTKPVLLEEAITPIEEITPVKPVEEVTISPEILIKCMSGTYASGS
jgi:hypothetical protein